MSAENADSAIASLVRITTTDRDGKTKHLEFPRRPVVASDWRTPNDLGVDQVVLGVLYGFAPETDHGDLTMIEAEWVGNGSFVVVHDLEGRRSETLRNGVRIDHPEMSAGQFLFGLDRDEFALRYIVDGRRYFCRGGIAEVRASLQKEVLGREGLTSSRRPEELIEIRQRKQAVKAELDALASEDTGPALDPVDPPALDDLLEAVEEQRRHEATNIRRRLMLADASQDIVEKPPVTAPTEVLDRIEEVSKRIEVANETIGAIGKKTRSSALATTARVMLVIAFLSSSGLIGAGWQLADEALLRFGIAAAIVVVAVAALSWIASGWRLVNTVRKVKAERAKIAAARHDALPLVLRLGHAVTEDDVTPEFLRSLSLTSSHSSASRDLAEKLKPATEDALSSQHLHGALERLERPLLEAAMDAEKGTTLPIDRLTRAALALASDWQRALAETIERSAELHRSSARRDADMELLTDALRRLETAERSLVSDDRVRQEGGSQMRTFAQRLNKELVPVLTRALGERAPSRFADDLTPEFALTPTASVNAFVLLAARLLCPRARAAGSTAHALLLVDSGIAIGEELEPLIIELVVHAALGSSIIVLDREKRRLHAMRQRYGDLQIARRSQDRAARGRRGNRAAAQTE